MTANTATERIAIGNLDLEVIRKGRGRPLLVLHGFDNFRPDAPFIEALAQHRTVIAPSLPGFGASKRPDDVRTVADLVNVALAVLESIPDEKVSVMGCSFGGWIAAELAIKSPRRIDRLVLADPLGLRISPPQVPDVLDIFNTHPAKVRAAAWHDPAKWAPDHDEMEDPELVTIARNWEAMNLYGWVKNCLFDPGLKRWLGHIKAPTLVLWGASDGIVKPALGEVYARAIPGARFELIPQAGHHPHIEQADAFVERAAAFLNR